jgi:hypothetical protein
MGCRSARLLGLRLIVVVGAVEYLDALPGDPFHLLHKHEARSR